MRAEAQSLVAEAQLTNITRQKFKEAYDLHTAAVIERAEKQILLAKYARQLLNMLDDTPVVPGDAHQPYAHAESARDILNEAEDELRMWEPNVAPIHSSAGHLGTNAVPGQMAAQEHHAQTYAAPVQTESHVPASTTSYDTQSQAGEPFISSEQMEAEQQRQLDTEAAEHGHYTTNA